jgi:hypothetical protein
MRILLIDDMREFGKQIPGPGPDDETAHAKTFEEGITELEVGGPWDVLYLDHDLGDPDPAKTGYAIINWIEAKAADPVAREFFLPKKIILVTSNPVGRRQMQTVIDKLYRE